MSFVIWEVDADSKHLLNQELLNNKTHILNQLLSSLISSLNNMAHWRDADFAWQFTWPKYTCQAISECFPVFYRLRIQTDYKVINSSVIFITSLFFGRPGRTHWNESGAKSLDIYPSLQYSTDF